MAIAHLSLIQIVKSYDFDGLTLFVVDRHDLIIADSDVIDLLAYLGQGFVEACHGEHYLDARLRRKLRLMGYFDRMFGQPEPFCEHIVWNALHWPWENGLADLVEGPRRELKPERDHEPRYTRSRLPKSQQFITPVNALAFKVAKPPHESRWMPCVNGETVTVEDKTSARQNAYEFAKRRGMQARIRKTDGGQIEVRFENVNGTRDHSSKDRAAEF